MKKLKHFLFVVTMLVGTINTPTYTYTYGLFDDFLDRYDEYLSQIPVEDITDTIKSIDEQLTSSINSNINKTDEIRLNVNFKFPAIQDKIIVVDNNFMISLDDCSNAFYATTHYNKILKKATIKKGDDTLTFFVDKNYYELNNEKVTLYNSVSAKIIDGIVYIPFEPLATSLNYHLSYDEDTNVIFAIYNDYILEDTNFILLNKQNTVSNDYVPNDLVYANVNSTSDMQVTDEVNDALVRMFDDAKEDGVALTLVSGYRSYDTQDYLYRNSVKNRGRAYTNKYILKAGQSEHQSGLAVDISSESNNYALDESFENTQEFKWLDENAYKYGFILRYPEDKVNITDIAYEPWHYRYIGDPETAYYIKSNNLSYEEFLYKAIN